MGQQMESVDLQRPPVIGHHPALVLVPPLVSQLTAPFALASGSELTARLKVKVALLLPFFVEAALQVSLGRP